jgi:glycosyltransferase involved in cell wall biosynthesis
MARRLGMRLVLAGGAYNAEFATSEVLAHAQDAPDWHPGAHTDAAALYVGARPRHDLFALMAGASALILPVRWPEPFGLVAIEAQAAGCPVVAYNRGGLGEVILDGRTGFAVEPDDEAAFEAAVRRVETLDRRGIRAWAVERFSRAAMAMAYERVYRAAGARDGARDRFGRLSEHAESDTIGRSERAP